MDFLQPFYKKDFIKQVYRVHDTSSNSPYVEFVDMPTYIGGGVSVVKFYPSIVNLHTLAPFEVEVLDTLGNAVRTEVPDFRDRFGNYYVSIYVEDSTAEGYGSISFVGVANATLDGEYIEYDDVNNQGYNLIIAKPLLIQPFERNESPLIFDRPPLVSIAQVITPARAALTNTSPGKNLDLKVKYYTASFITANVEGFDKVSATSLDIQDPTIRDFAIKNKGESSTTNQVITTVRQNDYDIQGGQLLTDTNRFRTIVKIPGASDISSNDKGAVITLDKNNTFANVTRSLSSAAVYAKSNPYNSLDLQGQTQSLALQLKQYEGTVIRVLNSSSYLIDVPLQVRVDSFNSARKNSITRTATHTFRQASDILTTVKYSNPVNVVTSQTVSQSYLQFTFQEIKPIGGSVYRIKSFYRQNSLSGDYQLINDQRVTSTEYLTDARGANTLAYAKEVSPFLLFGHFQGFNAQTIISVYWRGFTETSTTFDTYYPLTDSATLMDSVKLPVTTPTTTTVLTTSGYQIYQKNQAFSFSFICVLDPNTTLEVYANSKPVSAQVYDSTPFAQAFTATKNFEKTRYVQSENRFGKYVGKIVNNTGEQKDYGRVVFDLLSDADGYGRPLFRVKSTDQTNVAGAYLSEISVTPLQRNGYTPEIYQYTVNAPSGFQSLVSESVDFKFEYYDHTGKQSEYVTYLNGVNLSLTSEIQGNVCQVENYKFVFNPTCWSVVTESATFRNTYIAPYGGDPITLYGGTSFPLANGNNQYYRSHSFAQVATNTNATLNGPFINSSTTGYVSTGWGKTDNGNLAIAMTGSTAPTGSQRRRNFPAYDQMYAQLSFNAAYGKAIYEPANYVKANSYAYGVGSSTTGPNAVHTWSGWNALRPWKPIFAHKWLNKTREATDNWNNIYVFDGRFIYTSSWEIYPALGQPVTVNGAVAPTGLTYSSWGAASLLPVKATTVIASWRFFDQFSENYVQSNALAMLIDYPNPAFEAAAAAYTASYNRAVISASYAPVGVGVGSLAPRLGTSSFDLQPVVNSGAAGITRFHVSQSYVTTSGGSFTTAEKAIAYKQRRFYFPFSGPLTGSVFTENGGIYNVKFRLKRYQSGSNSQNWFVPDTGSYLMAYIFDVSSSFDGISSEGQPGYYPPTQNIIKIGNQITSNGYNIPPILFYDSASGYLYDEYDINLIQYGTPGQLVFEPSGNNGAYFACAIDDVEFCKIGTTTDPYYIKPPSS